MKFNNSFFFEVIEQFIVFERPNQKNQYCFFKYLNYAFCDALTNIKLKSELKTSFFFIFKQF